MPDNAPWPPPPDPASLKELFANADVEGFIASGDPADEYDIEAEEFFTALDGYSTAELTADRMLPILEEIWAGAFELDDAAIAQRRPKLQGLAAEVARFFGPEAQPQVRGS